jgi:hypothetical protein
MPAGNDSPVAKPGSRLRELGLVLPTPPSRPPLNDGGLCRARRGCRQRLERLCPTVRRRCGPRPRRVRGGQHAGRHPGDRRDGL